MPHTAAVHELMAEAHHIQGRHELATREWEETLRLEPGNHRLQKGLARSLWLQRDYRRALAGEQRNKRPLYTAGVTGTDETSRAMFARDFAKLEFDQQTAVLKAIEKGAAQGETWKKTSSAQFFSTVWLHVLEGFYGPPDHGGNKDYTSWKMVGFPMH